MNRNLPIYEYRTRIVSAIRENTVTIIAAETGSGKSTQVPQYLYEEGFEVVVTEPRRLAARTVAERVADEVGVKLGSEVGYRTAFEREDSKDTKILFCTDGLQLVRELTADSTKINQVLIIDEVHEWNLNIETLVAWVKSRIEEGINTKVVIMSATMETEKLKEFFGDVALINIPGRLYPVSECECAPIQFLPSIARLAKEGKNVLAFVPGKKEIDETIRELELMGVNAVVLPLHGELSVAEQRRCFDSFRMPKIVVATNVAQTSVTVPDIQAVVDSGLERRIETDSDGVSGLFLHDVSKADCKQRKGRAGRTEAGEYYLCSNVKYEAREDYSVPEIQRSILDQVVLRLAAVGLDATKLNFFHQPSYEALQLAYTSLTHLGALSDGDITELGRKMARIPLSAKYARMIIEAEKYGVVEDVISIAAILECGSLIDHRSGKSYFTLSTERSSDLLAELEIWNKLMAMGYVNFKEEGINGKIFFKVKELRNKLIDTLSHLVEFGDSHNREMIMKACLAGMVDNLYVCRYGVYYDMHRKGGRRIDKKSLLCFSCPTFLIGQPFTIEYKSRWGIKSTMELINMASEVKLEWIHELYPALFKTVDSRAMYLPGTGCYVTRTTYFNGIEVAYETVNMPDHPDAKKVQEEFEDSERRHRERILTYIDNIGSRSIFDDAPKPIKQKTVTVDGMNYDVSYEWPGDKPYIELTRYDLKNLTVKSIKLDNGKQVNLRCGTYSANNVPALSTKVQEAEIVQARERVVSNLGEVSSANEKVVMNWFDKLGKTFIVGRWNGEAIYEYVYLALKDNLISLKLTADESLATSETDAALRFLFGRVIKSKYPAKKFEVKKLMGKVKVKSEEKELFDEFVRDALDGISTENFSERLDMIDEFFKELMND